VRASASAAGNGAAAPPPCWLRQWSTARAFGATRIDAMVNSDNEGGIAYWSASRFELDAHDGRWTLLL
jgi:hypothetical protein